MVSPLLTVKSPAEVRTSLVSAIAVREPFWDLAFEKIVASAATMQGRELTHSEVHNALGFAVASAVAVLIDEDHPMMGRDLARRAARNSAQLISAFTGFQGRTAGSLNRPNFSTAGRHMFDWGQELWAVHVEGAIRLPHQIMRSVEDLFGQSGNPAVISLAGQLSQLGDPGWDEYVVRSWGDIRGAMMALVENAAMTELTTLGTRPGAVSDMLKAVARNPMRLVVAITDDDQLLAAASAFPFRLSADQVMSDLGGDMSL